MNGDRRDITSLCELQVRSPVSRTKVRTTNLLPVDWLLAQRHQRNSALNKDGNTIDFIIQDSRLFASIRVHSRPKPKRRSWLRKQSAQALQTAIKTRVVSIAEEGLPG